ncbi:MAG: class I SAM-dependent methyltransferase [Mesorhizobium sp.]|nr:class I SAM-dependent methyltransferase [Mesorhizobium sp.]
MGTEQPPDYYDAHMERFLAPYEESIWKQVYDATVTLMPEERSQLVVDVGCGTGRLAEALRLQGYENYIGFDFAPARIAEARRYLPSHDFRVLDAFSDEAASLTASADVVAITEMLEHIEDDLKLLAVIPAGRTIVFSVPNFGGPTHVRKFKSVDEVLARYSGLIEIDVPDAITVTKKSGSLTFVCRGRRR